MNRRNFLLLSALAPVFAHGFVSDQEDIYLSNNEIITLKILHKRLRRVRRHVGFGHFNYLSFDRTLFYARNYSSIGRFTKSELDLIEKLFYDDPYEFGFYGKKTVEKITNKIFKKDIQKIPHSGHYVYKGKRL